MSDGSGTVIWLTGLPGSGKTTTARALLGELHTRGHATLWLDSDELRKHWPQHGKFTDEDRDLFYGMIGHLAIKAAAGGCTAVVSATASKRSYRDDVRRLAPAFVEVWLNCDLETLKRRDPKGLYAAAERGDIAGLPGHGAPFEAPDNADVVADTTVDSVEKTVAAILAHLGNA